jgi:hypothetical protein
MQTTNPQWIIAKIKKKSSRSSSSSGGGGSNGNGSSSSSNCCCSCISSSNNNISIRSVGTLWLCEASPSDYFFNQLISEVVGD